MLAVGTAMETNRRIISKAMTWQTSGIATMTVLSYPHTETLSEALLLALSASATGFVAFLIHEKIWNRVSWGRVSQTAPAGERLPTN